MENWGWFAENSAPLSDLGTVIFAVVGAVFAFLAWQHRNVELKEKLFDRRFRLYWDLNVDISRGRIGGNLEWMKNINEFVHLSDFLFGATAKDRADQVRHWLEEIQYADSTVIDSDDRVNRLKELRKNLDSALAGYNDVCRKALRLHRRP